MDLLWTVVAVLLILWLVGFVFGVGGVIIHILLVIAVIVLVYRLIKGKNLLTGK
jgi:hypothetical protein